MAAFYKNRKGVYHTWYSDISQLAAAIEQKDLTADAVYHACASYGNLKDKKGRTLRTKENVHGHRCLFCEVDIRDDKGYPTKEAALEGLAKFLVVSKFPIPIIIDSGGGYHFYWSLEEDISREVWEKYAQGLKAYAAKVGFKIDASITADAARILRTPGTTNRKYTNTMVVWDVDTGPYSLDQFSNLLLQNPKPVKPTYTPTMGDANLIFNQCNQLRLFRDDPARQDGLTWVACARLLQQCNDGERIFHELSSKDPRYDQAEANKKWEESVKFNNATTCERFESINPSGCEACPLKGTIKSPIKIGRSSHFKLPEDVAKELAAVEMPHGYSFDKFGKVVFTTEKKGEDGEGEAKSIYVTEFPVFVTGRSVNEATNTDYKLTLRSWQPHDGWTTTSLDAAELMRNTEATLAGKGVVSNDDRFLKRYIKASMNSIARQKAAGMAYETFGWKNKDRKAFLLGRKLYTAVKDEQGEVSLKVDSVALTEAAEGLADYIGPGGHRKRGSFAAWQDGAQSLCMKGHEWQLATVIASFAGIVMPFCLPSEGGIVWSTYDYEGGAGKTLATTAAASVWGDFERLGVTTSDTPKSRIQHLGVLCHIPMPWDEMKRTDPDLTREFVQTFTSGKEGSRLTQSGEKQKHNRHWCTTLITSSNQELMGAIGSADGSKAMMARVFEVRATKLPLAKKEFKESFKRKFLDNPGFAGELFVKAVVLLQGHDMLEGLIEQAEERLTEQFTFGPQQRFKLAFFKGMYVTAHILADTGIINFSPERIINWLLEENGSIDKEKNEWIDTPSADMSEVFARYLQENVRRTLVAETGYHGKPVMIERYPTDELTIRVEKTGNIFISKAHLGKWLQAKDISLPHFVDEMAAKKAIKDSHARRSLGAGTGLGNGQIWCIILDGKHPEIAPIVAQEDNVISLEEARKQIK